MPDQSRALPGQPSLRYLKLEAKRRLSAGEFATLHEAQLAIAREHGLPSWTALKEYICAGPSQASPVLAQARWVISRFAEAGTPGWTVPGDGELGEHFDARFLRQVPPETLVRTLTGVVSRLREELVITLGTPLRLRGQIGGLQLEAAAAARPAAPADRAATVSAGGAGDRSAGGRAVHPHVRSGARRRGRRGRGIVRRARPAGPGPGRRAPRGRAGRRERMGGRARLGQPGASLGGASLDGPVPLTPDHRFPAYSVTKLITATVVLRLAADGRIGLDDPARAHLHTVRLADETVTVRDLLTHTAGVENPGEMFAERVPDLVTLVGPVVASAGPRGTFSYSNGGYALLGQLIADVTGGTYPEAATRMVLGPLGMSGSWFPASWPDAGAVTGYHLAGRRLVRDGPGQDLHRPGRRRTVDDRGWTWSASASPGRHCCRPGWPARLSVRRWTGTPTGAQMGLGWLLNEPKDVGGHAGGGPGAAASLIIRLSTGQPSVALANRLVPIEPVNARLVRPVA